jgi:integrase
MKLRAKEIEHLPAGYHSDGNGLRLVVDKAGNRRWTVRATIDGKQVSRGLGSYPLISLETARDEALDVRRGARKGLDLARRAKVTTFRQAFQTVFKLRQERLSNAKHIWQWQATMETYAFPFIANRPVADITHADVLEVLEPIWNEKEETARRLLQRMEIVFKSAILRGWREKASPCIGVAQELGAARNDVEHHRALPYKQVPAFIQQLRTCNSNTVTKLAFEWLILTAARSGEVRGATKAEIQGELWVIPPNRMKGRQEHKVPLSARCLEIAVQAHALSPSGLVFPSKGGKPLSNMTLTKVLRDLGVDAVPHGFRSSFKDWAAERGVRDEVSEAALAHQVPDKVRAAYLRTRFLDERRQLMEAWAEYATSR